MAEEATWGYPRRRPFLLLAIIAFAGALQAFAVAAAPPEPTISRAGYVTIGSISLLLGLLLVTIGPRFGPRLLGGVVLAATCLVAGVSALTRTGEGQLLAGFSLAMLGVFSGYFLSVKAVKAFLGLTVVLYPLTLWLNPQLSAIWYGLAVTVMTVGITLVVTGLVRHLRALALHDPLTGALNRQGLADGAEFAHELDARNHVETTIVEIDLNGFKQYNDTHGHQAGDELLAAVVRDWSSVLRRTDLLSRTGGDEFVLVLPGTSVAEAENLITRMREVNAVGWAAGLSVWEPGQRLPAALDLADAEMYRQKTDRRTPPPG